jgi:RNA polymerase sigma-70 factor (ECF subfamily)
LDDIRNTFSEENNGEPADARHGDAPDIIGLVKEAAGGSYPAFEQLYRLYVKQIFRYVYYQLGDRMTAEDITEDVFIRVLERIRTCAGREATFKAWLYRIARNRVVDHLRSQRKHLSIESDRTQQISDRRSDPARDIERRELWEVLREIPPGQSQVVILKFLAGLENQEIAQILGKSEGAVRILQMRGLALLRKKMGGAAFKDRDEN